MARVETFYDVIRRQGISRRSFLKFCSLTAASLGLAPAFGARIAEAMETKPRIPCCGFTDWNAPAAREGALARIMHKARSLRTRNHGESTTCW